MSTGSRTLSSEMSSNVSAATVTEVYLPKACTTIRNSFWELFILDRHGDYLLAYRYCKKNSKIKGNFNSCYFLYTYGCMYLYLHAYIAYAYGSVIYAYECIREWIFA